MIEILSLQSQTGTGSPSSSRAADTAAEGGGGPLLAGCVPQRWPPERPFPLCFSPLWKWVLSPCSSSILRGCASCCQRKISHLQGTLWEKAPQKDIKHPYNRIKGKALADWTRQQPGHCSASGAVKGAAAFVRWG